MMQNGIVGQVVTQGGNLNLRNASNMNGAIIGSMPNGARVIVLGEENGFYEVVFNGQEGFASASFITLTPNATGTVNTSGSNLNLRAAPSLTANVIASMPNGSSVIILGEENGFYKVRFNGREGYASMDFIRLGADAQGIVTTSGGNLNLRAAPQPNAAIVGSLPNGTNVTVLGQQGNFYLVRTANGQEGYASIMFVFV
jgi:uncharacterized protein YgiM (DUF1202 family)